MVGAPIPGDCGGTGCPEYTTPTATVGLCLSDGTPIAVVVTRDCDGVVTGDGWIDLASGIFTAGNPPGGTIACGDNYSFALSGWLCDVLGDGSVAGIALVQIERDAQGAVIGITLIGVDGLPYVPQGTMERCPSDDVEAEVLCDAGNGGAPFVRFYTYSASGVIPSRDTDLDGNPYVAVGPAERCGDAVTIPDPLNVEVVNTPLDVTGTVNIGNLADPLPVEVSNFPASQTVDGVVDVGNFPDDTEFEILCDFPPLFPDPLLPVLQFIRRYDVDGAGTVTVTDTELDGVTPHVPYVGGRVATCEVGFRDFEPIILCDVGAGGTQFARHYRDTAIGVLTTDTLLDGITPYTAIGPISVCAEVTGSGGGPVAVDGTVDVGNWRDDAEYVVLCDDDTDPATPFLRRFDVDEAGTVVATDTLLDGVTPFVPVGPIGVCAADLTIPDPLPVTGTVDIGNLPDPFEVNVNNFPATQTVDGSVDIGNWRDDAEVVVLCDQGTTPPTAFLRRYDVDALGAVTTIDTDLDGITAYAPVGPVGVCSPDLTIPDPLPITGTVDVASLPEPVSVDDDGGSLTVDTDNGPLDVNVGNFPATQTVDGTVDVGNFPATQTVDGTVNVGNFPATQTVDGTVDVGNHPDDREVAVLCDAGAANAPFLRRYNVTPAGVVTAIDTLLDGTTPYVVVGPAVPCAAGGGGGFQPNTSGVIVTSIAGVGASHTTSVLARRVKAWFQASQAGAGQRPTINGVAVTQTTEGPVVIEFGDLATAGTIPPITFTAGTIGVTIVEEL